MKEHQIKFPKTAHYYTLGQPNKKTKKFFIVFHGYGQLASRIIQKFDQLGEDCFIVAPEGFSRFYWNEQQGIVGASWMTKANRLSEIEDYSNYIEYLYNHFKNQLPGDASIHILGFSQGGTTAMRWIERNRPQFDNLILWGASFPMDLNYHTLQAYLTTKKIFLVYGRQDEYLSKERLEVHERFTKEQALNFETIWFEGKHVIDRSVLHDLVNNL